MEALEVLDPAPTAEQHVEAAGERARLAAALRRLSPVQREVVLLTLEGLPQREIAEVLGISEPNVAVRLSRARAELTRRLGGTTPS
jgi:RNA polymerase sigma factor (sigma-70 family)